MTEQGIAILEESPSDYDADIRVAMAKLHDRKRLDVPISERYITENGIIYSRTKSKSVPIALALGESTANPSDVGEFIKSNFKPTKEDQRVSTTEKRFIIEVTPDPGCQSCYGEGSKYKRGIKYLCHCMSGAGIAIGE